MDTGGRINEPEGKNLKQGGKSCHCEPPTQLTSDFCLQQEGKKQSMTKPQNYPSNAKISDKEIRKLTASRTHRE